MVRIKALKESNCDSVDDFYQKIIDLTRAGDEKEAIVLIEKLSDQQKTHLLSYAWDNPNINGVVADFIANQL